MEIDAVINNNNANHDDEQEERGFNSALDKLRKNEETMFHFGDAQLGGWLPTARWSIPQSFQVAEALKGNNSIVVLSMDLHLCPYSAIFLFLDFLQATPRLEEVMLTYNESAFHDGTEMQDQYETQISRVFDAVLLNPCITKLATFGSFGKSAEALYNLLVQTKTLKSFTWAGYYMPNTRGVAFAVARGLARNSSLQNVELDARRRGDLDGAMAGIGFASTIESLTVRQGLGSKDFYAAISKVLHLTPTLKTIEVGNMEVDEDDDEDDEEAYIDHIFWDLRQPCAGLEKLALHQVCIGERIVDLPDIPPIENCNHKLQVLELSNTYFSHRRSVRLLWNLVGLKKLSVCNPVFTHLVDDDDSDDMDSDDDEEEYIGSWGELIRRNKCILEVNVVDENWRWNNCAMGIVSGAIEHKSLKTLSLVWGGDMDANVGDQLCTLLFGNETLQTLTLGPVDIEAEGADLLFEGLFHNTTLQSFGFSGGTIPHQSMIMTLEWLLFNQTLKTVDFDNVTIDGGDTKTICCLFSRLFQENTSLVNVHLPKIIINGANMARLVSGLVGVLVPNMALKLVSFSSCTLDRDAWARLQQALTRHGPTKMYISSIRLPPKVTTQGVRLKNFLCMLPYMPFLKEVYIDSELDSVEKHLLLDAVKTKKTLFSFTTCRDDNSISCPIEKEIAFYFKLNRYGRQILDYTNVHSSLWPIIFGRMTSEEPSDANALFFFVREYFANYRGGGQQQIPSMPPQQHEQQPHHLLEDSRPSKCARLD